MSRSSTIWKDSVRLFLLLALSPIILLLTGPVLTIAALKGRLSLPGGLTLNPGKHHRKNREIAFVMGIVLWAFTWGFVGWMGAAVYFNAMPNGGVSVTAIELTSMPLPAKTETPMPTPSPTFTTFPTQTPSPTDVSFDTPTPSPKPATATPAPKPTDTPIPTSPPATETPIVSVSLTPNSAAEISRQADAIQTVSAANRALRQAIASPSAQKLDDLGNFWQGDALTRVRLFAQEMHTKYRAPVQADYRLEGAYHILDVDSTGGMVITSQERWQYKGAGDAQTAFTIYTYTVHWDGSAWKIVDYDFAVP